jgi:flagellar motor switch protein FliM
MTKSESSITGNVEEEIIARASVGMQALPMLDVIFGRMATGMNGALKSQAAVLVDVSVEPVEYTTWSSAIERLDEFSVCGVAEADPWGGVVVTAMDPEFFFSTIVTQMGGAPSPGASLKRAPSLIERRLARRLVKTINNEMTETFSRLAQVKFKLDGIEAIKQVGSLQGANSPCAMVTFEMTLGECVGSLIVVFPMTTLEPAQEILSKMFLGEKLGGDGTWRETLMERISGSLVSVQARLHEVAVELGDVMSWEAGQIIDLGIDEGHEATIMCSGIPIFHGDVGRRRNDTIALRITREEGEEKITQEGEMFDG